MFARASPLLISVEEIAKNPGGGGGTVGIEFASSMDPIMDSVGRESGRTDVT